MLGIKLYHNLVPQGLVQGVEMILMKEFGVEIDTLLGVQDRRSRRHTFSTVEATRRSHRNASNRSTTEYQTPTRHETVVILEHIATTHISLNTGQKFAHRLCVFEIRPKFDFWTEHHY